MNKRLIILGFGILVFSLNFCILDMQYLDARFGFVAGLFGLAIVAIGAFGKE